MAQRSALTDEVQRNDLAVNSLVISRSGVEPGPLTRAEALSSNFPKVLCSSVPTSTERLSFSQLAPNEGFFPFVRPEVPPGLSTAQLSY